jgi:putative membrane protein
MGLIAKIAVGLVALIHIVIGLVEMFFWTRPEIYERLRPKVHVTKEEAIKVAPIVANVGLYNWFLALGLLWSLLPSSMSRLPESAVLPVRVFFLGCVMIAGVYGALTVSHNTLIIQTAFAAVALVLVWLSRSPGSGSL